MSEPYCDSCGLLKDVPKGAWEAAGRHSDTDKVPLKRPTQRMEENKNGEGLLIWKDGIGRIGKRFTKQGGGWERDWGGFRWKEKAYNWRQTKGMKYQQGVEKQS
eukprot:Gb_31952 [translate_table: standard]